MGELMSMCGYRCDICKAYAPNIKQNDQRKELSEMWKKYYELDIPAAGIYCDGCGCDRSGARRVDPDCPVRECVLDKKLAHCGVCTQYPCDIFDRRKGLCFEEAQTKLGKGFNDIEYFVYLRAYDNKTRLDEYIQKREEKSRKDKIMAIAFEAGIDILILAAIIILLPLNGWLEIVIGVIIASILAVLAHGVIEELRRIHKSKKRR